MRILWHSNSPIGTSGYSVQTALNVPRIKALGHDIAISANWGHETPLTWNGIKIYPRYLNPWGNDILVPHAGEHFGGNYRGGIVITLLDLWIMEPAQLQRLIVCPWVPIDHDPAPPPIINILNVSNATPIAFSRFGERKLQEAGLKPYYVPHGYDPAVFYPRPREEAREQLGWKPDTFIIGMVAANKGKPSRKSFPEVMAAFKKLREKYDDVRLYIHTEASGRSGDGFDLVSMVKHMGIPEEGTVSFSDDYDILMGVDPTKLRTLYNAFDVLVAPSMCEGFGLPVLEAQACGTPVIVSDFSAQTELCGAGWLVEGRLVWTNLDSWIFSPDIDSIYDSMEQAYKARGSAELRVKAYDFAKPYQIDQVVTDYWKPVLSDLEAKLDFSPLSQITVPELHAKDLEIPSDLISVVVSTKDVRADHTVQCFERLAQSKAKHELIVIQRNHGWTFSSAVNQGLRAAKGDYILLLNDDCFVEPETLGHLARALQADDVGAVGGLLFYANGTIQHAGGWIKKGEKPWDFGHLLMGDAMPPDQDWPKQEVDYVTGALLMTKRELIEQLGLLDESFPTAYEDTDYCLKLRNAGYKIIFEPKARAIHLHSATRGQSIESLQSDQALAQASHKRFREKYEA